MNASIVHRSLLRSVGFILLAMSLFSLSLTAPVLAQSAKGSVSAQSEDASVLAQSVEAPVIAQSSEARPPANTPASNPADLKLFQQHKDLSRTGMQILGGWALLNIAIGAAGRSMSSGTTRYVHEMNAGWNLVNLSIAGFALLSLQDLALESLGQAYRESSNLDRLLLLNSGLDAAYIATGGYLIERGLRKSDTRLQGYGRSLILQGGFLLVFDLALFALHQPTTQALLERMESSPSVSVSLSPSAPHLSEWLAGTQAVDWSSSMQAIPSMLTFTFSF